MPDNRRRNSDRTACARSLNRRASPAPRDIATRSVRGSRDGRRRRLCDRTSKRNRPLAGGRRRSRRQEADLPSGLPGKGDSNSGRPGRPEIGDGSLSFGVPSARAPPSNAESKSDRPVEWPSPCAMTLRVRTRQALRSTRAMRNSCGSVDQDVGIGSDAIRSGRARNSAAGKIPSPRLASVIGQRPTTAPLRGDALELVRHRRASRAPDTIDH